MQDYGGTPVAIGGGGFVTGIDIAPSGEMVCRTDGAGAYRWTGSLWQSVTSMISLADILVPGQQWGAGVYEIRIAPSAPDTLYMMFSPQGAGLSAASGFVLRSQTGGASWSRVYDYDATGGNANDAARMMGPKLAIDPVNPAIVYIGTPRTGVHVTRDGGSAWTQIPDAVIPWCKTPFKGVFPGHPGMRFDPASGVTGGRTTGIYVPSWGNGVYLSTDAGLTWALLPEGRVGDREPEGRVGDKGPSGPRTVCRAAMGAGGTYFCAANDTPAGTAWKYGRISGWKNITLGSGTTARGSVIPDPTDPTDRRILAVASGGSIRTSTDGGATWGRPIPYTRAASDVPWLAFTNEKFMSLGDMVFDGDGSLVFAEGIGVWKTSAPITWSPPEITWVSMTAGIENMLVTSICCPPGGDALITVLDRCGFTISDPTAYQLENQPDETRSIRPGFAVDYASDDPSFAVLTNSGWTGTCGLFSHCGGMNGSWQPIPAMPPASGTLSGFIAAASATNWVCGVNGKNPQYTTDGGHSWSEITTIGMAWQGHPVCADRENIGTFYAWQSRNRTLYRSIDGGAAWVPQSTSLPAAFQLIAVPGNAGHLFAAAGNTGGSGRHPGSGALQFSRDGGVTWTQISPGIVKEPGGVAVGARKSPQQGYWTLYFIGYHDGDYGVWQSIDFDPASAQATWAKLTSSPDATMMRMHQIGASLDTFGRVYVGASGNTLFYLAA